MPALHKMNRNITGTIRKTDGTVWAGAVIEFELDRSSFDQNAQYPSKPVRVVTDDDGELELVLWVNEEGLRPSKYICTLPDGSQFRFILPAGAAPADLNELRENAIEEDSPTQSQMVAFLPVMRQEAQIVVDDALVEVNAEIATKADQTALDATNNNVGQIVQDLDSLSHEVDDKASQADLNTTNAHLAALDTEVDTKANQSALNTTNANLATTNTNLAAANAVIATKANQSALDATNDNVGQIQQDVDDLEIEVGKKAYQTSLNTTNTNLQTVTQDLATANTVIATKANQSALNTTNANLVTTNTNLATTNSNLAAANSAIATKANQSELDITNSSLATTNSDLQTLTHSVVLLEGEVESKADQTALDNTNDNLGQLQVDLFTLDGVVGTKANQTALNTTNANLTALNTVVGTKANQSDLNTTNTNLATANDEIAIRARQTALNTTNSNLATTNTNLAAANAAIALRATYFELNIAISNLEDSISQAQATLEALIDQKADLSHTHGAGDVTSSIFNAIPYFNDVGEMSYTSDLTFVDGKLGLGTDNPLYTIDLNDPTADHGYQASLRADLNTTTPTLRLAADPNGAPDSTRLYLECGYATAEVKLTPTGQFTIGSDTIEYCEFYTGNGSTYYRGRLIGLEPSTNELPEDRSFGFVKNGHTGDLYFAFNDDGDIKGVKLESINGIIILTP